MHLHFSITQCPRNGSHSTNDYKDLTLDKKSKMWQRLWFFQYIDYYLLNPYYSKWNVDTYQKLHSVVRVDHLNRCKNISHSERNYFILFNYTSKNILLIIYSVYSPVTLTHFQQIPGKWFNEVHKALWLCSEVMSSNYLIFVVYAQKDDNSGNWIQDYVRMLH